jgi:hypothetical protein
LAAAPAAGDPPADGDPAALVGEPPDGATGADVAARVAAVVGAVLFVLLLLLLLLQPARPSAATPVTAALPRNMRLRFSRPPASRCQ